MNQTTAADQSLNLLLDFIARLEFLSEDEANRMTAAVQAELAPDKRESVVVPVVYEEVRGHVLRSKKKFAEIDINHSHGLHNWKRGNVYRNGKFIDTFAIDLTDDRQSSGFTDHLTHLEPGDEIVFRRPRPAPGAHPANALIGKHAELTFNYLPRDHYPKYALRIYEITVDAFGGISSVVAGDDSLMPRLERYESKYLDTLTTDSEKFVLDLPTGQLIAPDLLANRDRWRSDLIQARERELKAEAERQRMLAETARLEREMQARKAEERRQEVEAYAQRHLAPGSNGRGWMPAPGYDWINRNDPNNMNVRWVPGQRHPDTPSIVSSWKEGDWEAAAPAGYVDSRSSRNANGNRRRQNQGSQGISARQFIAAAVVIGGLAVAASWAFSGNGGGSSSFDPYSPTSNPYFPFGSAAERDFANRKQKVDQYWADRARRECH
jgi:hypothetical protein